MKPLSGITAVILREMDDDGETPFFVVDHITATAEGQESYWIGLRSRICLSEHERYGFDAVIRWLGGTVIEGKRAPVRYGEVQDDRCAGDLFVYVRRFLGGALKDLNWHWQQIVGYVSLKGHAGLGPVPPVQLEGPQLEAVAAILDALGGTTHYVDMHEAPTDEPATV